MSEPVWPPPLLFLEDYDGDVAAYLDAVYAAFCEDWLSRAQLLYRGKRVSLKRHPMLEGKEATFWHFVTSGEIEVERLPELRRWERIRWPRALLDGVGTDHVREWVQDRRGARGERRIALAPPDFSYLFILAERSDYVLPWTAFCIEHEWRRQRLQTEWQDQQ